MGRIKPCRKRVRPVSQCLEAEGIDSSVGVPGDENADLMIPLEDSEIIRFIRSNFAGHD